MIWPSPSPSPSAQPVSTTPSLQRSTWSSLPEVGAAVEPPAAADDLPSALAPPALAFDEADLARACAGAAAAARAGERAVLEAERETRVEQALAAIAAAFDGVDGVLEERRQQLRRAAATLAASAAAAVAPRAPKQLAARLAQALVDDCLGRLDPALALTVEVAPALADALAARLDGSPVVQARPGRVAVEAVPDLAPGEARLVWADGHAEWSTARLAAEAEAFLARLAEPAAGPRPASDPRPAGDPRPASDPQSSSEERA